MTRKLGLIVCILLLFTSCTNTRKAVYFDGQGNATLPSNINIPQTVLAPNDLLSINVTSLNPTASTVFNMPNVTYSNSINNSGDGPIQASGYLVNGDGNIQFPMLGSVKVAGLTEAQLSERLTKEITDRKLLVDPIVTVRHLNFRVTVLGEVTRPTVINVPSEKITLLEALGFAGDITITGKRENVLIIREEAGQKQIQRVNLNTSEIFNSPYYYLRSNDIVYVEPNKAKIASSSRSNQLLPILLSGLSFAAIIVDRLTR